MRYRWNVLRFALLWLTLATTGPVIASEPGKGWRMAFESSPRAGLSETQFKALIERIKVAPEIAEKIRPKLVTGTLRYRIRVSAGGSKLRLRLSNEEGTTPLVIAAASVALAGQDFDAKDGRLLAVTFSGSKGITIPPGAPVVSDPIDLGTDRGDDVLVSFTVTSALRLDGNGGSLVSVGPGDQSMAGHMHDARIMEGRPDITGISVLTARDTHLIVALGDSITDGNRLSLTALHSWPEEVSQRLAARGSGPDFAIVNAGIAGNRLLANGFGGLAALARLDRDALALDGITHLIVLEGTNDIGMSGHSSFGENPAISPEDIISGYRQIMARAHDRGVKVILGTILPFGGSGSHDTPEHERLRVTVNTWIRTSGEPDAVIDFDKALRDPEKPLQLRSDYDSGDHLHPNEAGSKAMGQAIDLSIFKIRNSIHTRRKNR